MNAPAFTKGPWHWHCSRTLMHLHDANGRCFAEVSMRRSLMHEADANLIAAAPELYEALVRAERKLAAYVGVCEGDKELTNTVLPMARAALAKAVQS